jgi:hypothetical protein
VIRLINGNTIKFGYGDVLVGADRLLGTLSITEIEPPKEIGTSHSVNEEGITIIRSVSFIYGEDMHELMKKLNNLRELGRAVPELRMIQFIDYVFDFSHFDEKSVDVVREFVKKALYPLAIAC